MNTITVDITKVADALMEIYSKSDIKDYKETGNVPFDWTCNLADTLAETFDIEDAVLKELEQRVS